MPTLDTRFVRSQFPAFNEPALEGFAHFENAGGTFACRQVIESLDHYYRATKVQPHYGFEPSHTAGMQMQRARQRMASWLNVRTDEIHFGPSTSQNTYVVAQALRQHLKAGDEVIVTNQDHEANVGAWRRLEAEGIVIREWRINPETAELEASGLDALLSNRTRAVAFTHCSNIVGSMNPVREWADKIHAAGALVIVDGVSYAGHGLPDLQALGADIYLFSLYKVYGPHLGVMFMRKAVNEELPNQGHFFNAGHPTDRFTPAGPDHAQIASVNGIFDYFEAVYDHHFGSENATAGQKTSRVRALFQHTERRNLKPVLAFLGHHPKVRLIGKDITERRAPTVSFTVDGRDPSFVAAALAEKRIGIANGNCYAWRLMEALSLRPETGVIRLSFVHYTLREEVDRVLAALDSIL